MRDRLQELTGTSQITTDQGDYVGTIPDDRYREEILNRYNSPREADLELDIEKLEDKISALEDTVQEKDDKIEEQRETISDQEMKIIEQEEELKELGDTLALHNATIQELQEKLAQYAD